MIIIITILISLCTLVAGFFIGWLLALKVSLAKNKETEDSIKTVFQALAAEQLDRSTDRFVKMASEREKIVGEQLSRHKEAVSNLLTPLSEKLREIEKNRQESYGKLANELQRVTQSNEKLRTETTNLTNALRQPQVRGRWGETTLKRVVELAGMVDHVDFEEQVSTTTETGRLRPDMVINMPNGHNVVVDSKVALNGYLQACEQTELKDKEQFLIKHAQQMRTHVKQLSQKEYWSHLTDGTEFVVMFVPGEHFLSAALQYDATLMDNAMKNKVVIATPTTLIALLRAIEYGWRSVALEKNAKEISELGKELYTRANVFISHLENIKKGLQNAMKSFNDAVGSLEHKFLPQLRRFKELRADDGKEISELNTIEKPLRSLPPEENN